MALPADLVLMIRPADTADKLVLQNFDALYNAFKKNEVQAIVFEQNADSSLAAMSPSCWLITLPDGTVAVLPMFRRERRQEKRDDILEYLRKYFLVNDIEDWSEFEVDGFFLEGTASMVIDHENKLIYACISQRTHTAMLEKFAAAHRYKAITFYATDTSGKFLSHTNRMLCLGTDFALLCEEAFVDDMDLMAVKQLLLSTGYRIIPFSHDQLEAFMGNAFCCNNANGETFLFLSETATLTEEQQEQISTSATIIRVTLKAIEEIGGASVSTIVAPVFIPVA
jgi:hypothetical protein